MINYLIECVYVAVQATIGGFTIFSTVIIVCGCVYYGLLLKDRFKIAWDCDDEL
jgi:hypothetical protein